MTYLDDDLRHFALDGAPPLPAASTEGRVEYAGARVWYASYGSGDAVVLLHGAFDNSEDWGYQLPTLVDSGHRAILIDNRGRGRSTLGSEPLSYELMAREVLAVMDALGIARFAVVGWSDGAIVGLILAMQHPSRVSSVFAFGCSMDLGGVKDVDPSMPILGLVFGRANVSHFAMLQRPDQFNRAMLEFLESR
jgi:pimeloyl-ACP methyl ester carboxylesterase